MASWFVRPETKTLALSDGQTLVVRKRLSSGEQRSAYAKMFVTGVDGKLHVNPLQTGTAIITAFLLDWSLRDDNGEHVNIRGIATDELTALLDKLDPEHFAEIKEAIEAHEIAMNAERAQEKKVPLGAPNGLATSPLLSGVDGASSGSAH
jgi:hypothetical protein